MAADSAHGAPRVLVWTDTGRCATARATVDALGQAVGVIGVGGPRGAGVDELARDLGCPRGDDLRRMLVEARPELVLLLTPTGVTAEELSASVDQGATVVVTEPLAADFGELQKIASAGAARRAVGISAGGEPTPTGQAADVDGGPGRIVWAMALERSPGWAQAADPVELLGTPRLVTYGCYGGTSDASLYARLHDAWRVVLDLCGLPDQIDASLTGPLAEAPTSLRGLTGHCAAHARFAGGAAAVIQVTDRSGSWKRRLEIAGDQGFLRLTDDGYTLFDAQGQRMDRSTRPAPVPAGIADLIAGHLRWLTEHRHGEPPDRRPPGDQQILGCCAASLLSARTGAPESPRKLMGLYAT